MLNHSHVGIHKAVDAVAHARFLITIQSASGDLGGDALFEACVGEAVDC